MTFLIIDRDDFTLQFWTFLFKSVDYKGTLVMFSNFEEAEHYISGNPLPDMVVADFYLSHLDDFHFLNHLQNLADEQDKDLLIALPADFASDKRLALARVTDEFFVVKPVMPEMLKRWIEVVESKNK